MNKPVVLVQWAARALSVLIIGVCGFFIVAHLVGSAGQASRPLRAADYGLMAMMGAWVAGLAMAWRWELAGALITLAASVVMGSLNARAVTGFGLLPPFAALMFLASWWMRRNARTQIAA